MSHIMLLGLLFRIQSFAIIFQPQKSQYFGINQYKLTTGKYNALQILLTAKHVSIYL